MVYYNKKNYKDFRLGLIATIYLLIPICLLFIVLKQMLNFILCCIFLILDLILLINCLYVVITYKIQIIKKNILKKEINKELKKTSIYLENYFHAHEKFDFNKRDDK